MNYYLIAYYDRSTNDYCPKDMDEDDASAWVMYKIKPIDNRKIIRIYSRVIVQKAIGYYPSKKIVKGYQRHCAKCYRPSRGKDDKRLRIKIFDTGDEIHQFEDDDAAKLYFEIIEKNKKY